MALNATISGRPVGRVLYDGDRLSFVYDSAWIGAPGAFPLSPPLAFDARDRLSPEAWSARCRRFFENLLPEGRALDDILAANTVSRSNLFALLRILGRESTGALTLVPDGTPPTPDSRREVPQEELSSRIRTRDAQPFTLWDGRVRLSIAGAQDKLGVCIEDGRFFLVDGGLATTHILKPEPARFPELVVNEAFCLRLARAIGLPAAEATIERVPEPVLSVQRFDRVHLPEGVARVHVIDACQALDLPVTHKYERHLGSGRDVADVRDGASLPRLFSLSAVSPGPALTRRSLIRRVVFDYLVGNADAHGKNFSFHVTPAGLTLAPAYDLVCVAVFVDLDQGLAMAIGDQFDGEAVALRDWVQMADDCDLPRAVLLRECTTMARRILAVLPTVGVDLAVTPAEDAALSAIRQVVTRRAEKLLALTARPA